MAQLRSKAREFARRFAGKTVTVVADGARILMPWTGIRHALSGNVGFVTAVVATKLDQLIERGRLAETVPDNKGRAEVKASHYDDTPVVISGEPSVVRIVVREMSDGKRYYDHFENREAAADGGSRNLPGNEPGPSSLQPAPFGNEPRCDRSRLRCARHYALSRYNCPRPSGSGIPFQQTDRGLDGSPRSSCRPRSAALVKGLTDSVKNKCSIDLSALKWKDRSCVRRRTSKAVLTSRRP